MLETKFETKQQQPAETLSAEAEALLKQAQAGDAAAQYQLGVGYLVGGKGFMINDAEAVTWFKKAALQGYALAEYRWGACLYYGFGIQEDKEKAEALFLQALPGIQKATAEGDAEAQRCLGQYYLEGRGSVKKDEKEGFAWTQKAALQAHAPAQYNLGICYDNGQGVEKDDKQAAAWYQKAALQGYALAQYNLGVCHANGQGVEKDAKQAAAWYQKAALQGHAAAQCMLGVCYGNGQGVEKDDKQAAAWYQKAALQGHAVAQSNLGWCYFNGQGVEKDDKQAAAWYQKAALQGHAYAQVGLGFCYGNGQGVEKDAKQAAAWYQKAALLGHAPAQCYLGICYENGQGVEKDAKQAAAWYQKAALQGHAQAQLQLGLCYTNGQGVEKDDKQAAAWYQKAALQGDAPAQRNLGSCYANGQGVEKDDQQAFFWYQKAALQGHAQAQYYLGWCYFNGQGVEKDDKQAAAWWQKAALLGDAEAQRYLGICYQHGQGVEKDDQQAFTWYQKAALQGHAPAQRNLGSCYAHGQGVEKDDKQAAAWSQKAALQGDAIAQSDLGICYAHGRGVEKDDKQAAAWWQKAALQGDATAQYNLGIYYANGKGVEKDDKQAAAWLQKAALQGNAQAQYSLGICYENGRGVKQDFGQAMAWHQKAAEQGYVDAHTQIETLKKQGYVASPAVTTIIADSKDAKETKADSKPEVRVAQPASPVADKGDSKGSLSSAVLTAVPRIAWNELKVGSLIGNGSYGDVYQGWWQGNEVAIKQLQLKTLSEPLAKEFMHETDIMMQCQFPNTVRLYGVCTEAGHYALIMEYMTQSLRHRLQDEKPLPWSLRWQMAVDITQGLAQLHARKILHRDLKSLNILLDKHQIAKIADFGLAKVKQEVSSSTTKSSKTVGSVRWRAPELFKRHAIATPAADIYSLGMILWELATRQLPFSDAGDEVTVISWIQGGEQEKIPDDCPKALKEIIQACWAAPDKRPSAAEILTQLKQAQAKAEQADKEAEDKSTAAAERIWHFDPATKPATKDVKDYVLIDASAKDLKKVCEFYLHGPVPGYDVKSIRIIYNPNLNQTFARTLPLIQHRHGQAAFAPKWSQEGNKEWRSEIHSSLEQMAVSYQDSDYPNVKLLPVWHGTKAAILPSLFKTGFAALTSTDEGYFGKGLYSSWEPQYAYETYCQGALLVNWVAFYSAYPVIDGDMDRLMGKPAYQNYDAHFVPVVPQFPDPDCASFVPCKPKQKPRYKEIVVFERSQCLPRYLVELQPTLPKTLQPKGEHKQEHKAGEPPKQKPEQYSLAKGLATFGSPAVHHASAGAAAASAKKTDAVSQSASVMGPLG